MRLVAEKFVLCFLFDTLLAVVKSYLILSEELNSNAALRIIFESVFLIFSYGKWLYISFNTGGALCSGFFCNSFVYLRRNVWSTPGLIIATPTVPFFTKTARSFNYNIPVARMVSLFQLVPEFGYLLSVEKRSFKVRVIKSLKGLYHYIFRESG